MVSKGQGLGGRTISFVMWSVFLVSLFGKIFVDAKISVNWASKHCSPWDNTCWIHSTWSAKELLLLVQRPKTSWNITFCIFSQQQTQITVQIFLGVEHHKNSSSRKRNQRISFLSERWRVRMMKCCGKLTSRLSGAVNDWRCTAPQPVWSPIACHGLIS